MTEQLFKQVARMDGTNGFDLVPYTDVEMVQVALDATAFQARHLAEITEKQASVDARASGIAHALTLGFTQAQAEAMFP